MLSNVGMTRQWGTKMPGSKVESGGGRYPSVDDLLAQASANTGLTDFGPGDFREGLGWLLKSVDDDA